MCEGGQTEKWWWALPSEDTRLRRYVEVASWLVNTFCLVVQRYKPSNVALPRTTNISLVGWLSVRSGSDGSEMWYTLVWVSVDTTPVYWIFTREPSYSAEFPTLLVVVHCTIAWLLLTCIFVALVPKIWDSNCPHRRYNVSFRHCGYCLDHCPLWKF